MTGSNIRRLRIISICGIFMLLAALVFYPGASHKIAHYLGTTQAPVIVHHYETANTSSTKPPFYPLNGTGKTVDTSADFDTTRFQECCKMAGDIEAIVPVFSAPDNFERREAMRETVGKVCAQLGCKIFFIIGVSLDKDVYNKVKAEHASVNDILIVKKVDTYRDLNNKVVAMLDWLINYCSGPKYVIHIIDDFFPNLSAILDQLRSIDATRFVLGRILSKVRPMRQPDSKWYLSKDEYPYSVFPRYVSGVVYAFSSTDSVVLRQNVHAVEYCWIEDVWLGHLVKGSQFQHIALHRKYKDHAFRSTSELKLIWQKHVGIHQVTPDQFHEIYQTVIEFQ